MFGKEKTIGNDMPPVTKTLPRDIKTLIGEGCKVEGNFFIPTYTRVDGTVKGDLTGDSGIVIGVQGRVEGNICASEVVLYGTVVGNVETKKLELKKGASLNGDITVNHLLTEPGSTFNGKCTMSEDVQTEEPELEESPKPYST
jgi:cytoskeletal protein CcmA (bactofilin family)